jgi:hypothetical protein
VKLRARAACRSCLHHFGYPTCLCWPRVESPSLPASCSAKDDAGATSGLHDTDLVDNLKRSRQSFVVSNLPKIHLAAVPYIIQSQSHLLPGNLIKEQSHLKALFNLTCNPSRLPTFIPHHHLLSHLNLPSSNLSLNSTNCTSRTLTRVLEHLLAVNCALSFTTSNLTH